VASEKKTGDRRMKIMKSSTHMWSTNNINCSFVSKILLAYLSFYLAGKSACNQGRFREPATSGSSPLLATRRV
jgi:hypothetical protein